MARVGVDLGGTKIEAAVLDDRGEIVARLRKPNPGSYQASIATLMAVISEVEREAGVAGSTIGIGMPGSLSPATGLMRNANSVWLNGMPFKQDLERALGRPVRMENDANCFALSEAVDGAAAGAEVVFGAILGTGCGGGVVVRGRTVEGVNRIGGEWGHTPLPWPTDAEHKAHTCWCGRVNCLETWVSGTAFADDYERLAGKRLRGDEIMTLARAGDANAAEAFEAYVDRLGRAFAVICDILDPDVIVCGGGMSNTAEIYDRVPPVTARYAFSDVFHTRIVQARHGDSSGVRGAAWLWPQS